MNWKARCMAILMLLAPVEPLRADLAASDIPKEFFAFRIDDDCAVAGDSCRSCGELIIVSRKFLKQFDALDQESRKRNRTLRACEACNTGRAKLKCVESMCLQGQRAP